MLHRKERFIITAIEIIDELGIQNLSTRELARRQDISDATLFRHFKSKNELLVAVLDHYTKFDDDIYKSIKLKKLPPKEAIFYYFNSYLEYYENYPAITSIMHLFDFFRYEPDLDHIVKNILENRLYNLKNLLEDMQKSEDLPSHVNPQELACILSGTFRNKCLKWRLLDRNFSLKEETLSIIETILNAFGLK